MLSSAATPYIVFSIGFLIMVAVLANRISGRLGIPTLLVFIAVGMLAGSDGPGGIEFDNPAVANLIGVFALAYILFSGGLDTKWSKVKGVAWHAAALATLGVGIPAALVGIFASYILDFTIWEGL
ncbi:MAG TPA: cation:proton antiporter, partial [Polyangiaceae bacterium]|nr:cation:proton antiporter [Polyangiaceae bacterium]